MRTFARMMGGPCGLCRLCPAGRGYEEPAADEASGSGEPEATIDPRLLDFLVQVFLLTHRPWARRDEEFAGGPPVTLRYYFFGAPSDPESIGSAATRANPDRTAAGDTTDPRLRSEELMPV